MKKRIISLARNVLAVALLLTSGNLFGQNCIFAPDCILNGELTPVNATSGDMNSNANRTVTGWFRSHGTPSIFGGRTNPPTDVSLWMWARTGRGEGIFTCFNFQQGKTYEVCMWVRNTTTQGQQVPNGTFTVEATTGLNQATNNNIVPSPAPRQIISSTNINTTTWTFVTFSFQPTQNFNQLWMYPSFANTTPQYEIQVDDIAITRIIHQNEITISASPASINWCQSSVISLLGVPAGANVSWSPATGLNTTTGTSVIASPCVTTTYTATVTLPGNSGCAACTTYTRTYTQQIIVTPPRAIISGNPNVVCPGPLSLTASLPAGCPIASYSWAGPNGFSSSGPSFTINNPGAAAAGIYTVTISTNCGSFTQTVLVTSFDCPCSLTPTIGSLGCNPITFNAGNTSLTNIVGWYWEFGDGNTSTASNPSHQYASSGTYNVCLTIYSWYTNPLIDATDTCFVSYCETIIACGGNDSRLAGPETGSNNNADWQVKLFPNPASTELFVVLPEGITGEVRLLSVDGKELLRLQNNGSNTYTANLKDLAPGVYLIEVTGNDKTTKRMQFVKE